MFSRLFKSFGRKRWEDPNPDVRRQALAELKQRPDGQTLLVQIASADSDSGVRAAAIEHIEDTAALLKLASNNGPAVWHRISQLGALGRLPDSIFQSSDQCIDLLKNLEDPNLCQRALTRLSDEGQLVRVATEAALPTIRLEAAKRIHNEAKLIEGERLSRNRDKAVLRVLRERLEARRSHLAEIKSLNEAYTALSNRIRQLAAAQQDPLLPARVEHAAGLLHEFSERQQRIAQQRQDLADVPVPSHSTTELAATLQAINERLAESAKAREIARELSLAAAANQVGQDATAEHQGALTSLRALNAMMLGAESAQLEALCGALPNNLEQIQQRWYAASDRAAPAAADGDAFHQMARELKDLEAAWLRFNEHRDTIQEFADNEPGIAWSEPNNDEDYRHIWRLANRASQTQRRINQLLRQVRWPAHYPAPAELAAMAAAAAFHEDIETKARELNHRLAERATTILSELEAAIDAGTSRAANNLLNQARNLLRHLPPRSHQHLGNRFTHLGARVSDMRDWQDFATHPKRETLCANMEQLAATEMDVESKADRIKELRAGWQALGPAGSPAERELVDRFNAAAELAFAPCRVFFDEQNAIRKANLKERQRVCDELEGYIDSTNWEQADWHLAQQILRVARQEFLSFNPVERSHLRSVNERFDAIADRLHGLIKSEWEKNLGLKQAIVDEAKALTESAAPVAERVDAMKALQQRWRTVGVTPRRADQKLWNQLRQHADLIFEARTAERVSRDQAVEQQQVDAEAMCMQLEQRVDASEDINSMDELITWRDAFDALPLKGDLGRRLRNRFNDAETRYLNRLRDHQLLERRSAFDMPLQLHERLSQLERHNETADETLLAELKAAGLSPRQAVTSSFERAAIREQRHELTLMAEVAAGLESPPEDQEKRLSLRVNRLAQGLGQQERTEDDFKRLIVDWVMAGPDPGDAGTSALLERLKRAIEHYVG